MMRIAFDYEVDDAVAYAQYCYGQSKIFQRGITIVKWCFPVLSVLVLFFLGFLVKKSLVIVTGVIYLLVSVWWIWYIPGKMRKNSLKKARKKLMEQQHQNPIFFGNREMFFSEDGIRTVTQASDSTVKLSAVINVVKTDDYYFLFVSDIEALVIPIQKIGEENNRSLNVFLNTYFSSIFKESHSC